MEHLIRAPDEPTRGSQYKPCRNVEFRFPGHADPVAFQRQWIAPTKALLEQKFHLLVVHSDVRRDSGSAAMTTLPAVWLGAMLAWTPSVVLLAWLLREAPLDELDELQHDVS